MDHWQEHTLAIRLKTCGRFLYYQIGGKAGQQRILMRLNNHGPTTQKELQDVLEISSGALSEILQKMEDSGLILRTKSAEDKRQVDLLLTKAGREKAQSVEAHYHRTLDRTFECLTQEQKNQLEETLGILTAHLEEIKSDPAFAQSLDQPCMK
ncbi:MAG: MarR family transcriptional regulator [Eubacteriales bacterium]|nr:MarR family transcriptional regulator [Eubacteriales bacterium]